VDGTNATPSRKIKPVNETELDDEKGFMSSKHSRASMRQSFNRRYTWQVLPPPFSKIG
jgi:hypothetical protein